MNARDGVLKDDTIFGGDLEGVGGFEIAIGFRFAARVASSIDDRGKIAADGESIKDKVDVAC